VLTKRGVVARHSNLSCPLPLPAFSRTRDQYPKKGNSKDVREEAYEDKNSSEAEYQSEGVATFNIGEFPTA